jgi:hypothetical protein
MLHRMFYILICVVLLGIISAESNEIKFKYLLLTQQRSGSTWFCSELDDIDGVGCGLKNPLIKIGVKDSEMMIKYSFKNHTDFTWDQWVASSDAQFLKLEDSTDLLIGYKIMYDQIKEINIDSFLDYCASRNISIIHLGREAETNRISSASQGGIHTNDTVFVHNQMKHQLDEKNVERLYIAVKKGEQNIHFWSMKVRLAYKVYSQYVVYEQLEDRDIFDRTLSSLLSGITMNKLLYKGMTTLSPLLKLHSDRCCDREKSFYAYEKLYPVSSSVEACHLIEKILNSQNT